MTSSEDENIETLIKKSTPKEIFLSKEQQKIN
jgi:hypothetical protein